MCYPFNENPKYFYPSRKIVSFSFFSVSLLFPYIIYYRSFDAWLLAKTFLIFNIPVLSLLALKKFLLWNRKIELCDKLFYSFPIMIYLALFCLSLFGGNYLFPYRTFAECFLVLVSAVLTLRLILMTMRIRKAVVRYQHSEYSSEDDFPYKFVNKIFTWPIIFHSIGLVIFIMDSPVLTSCYYIIIMWIMLYMLTIILHPQRREENVISMAEKETCVDEIENINTVVSGDDSSVAEQKDKTIPDDLKDRIAAQIVKTICTDKLFLNSNLRRSDLVKIIGVNHSYISLVFRERFGSFYSYVNKLRIEYAIEYSKEHPDAKQSEIAENSGFGSVKTYTRVKKLYENDELND